MERADLLEELVHLEAICLLLVEVDLMEELEAVVLGRNIVVRMVVMVLMVEVEVEAEHVDMDIQELAGMAENGVEEEEQGVLGAKAIGDLEDLEVHMEVLEEEVLLELLEEQRMQRVDLKELQFKQQQSKMEPF